METPAKHYDLVVIGTGSAASPAAFRCRAAGWSVAVIDSHPFGGTCALRGCHPKKMLVSAAEALDATTRMAGKGVRADRIAIDWVELMRFKRAEIDPAPAFFARNFAQVGIEGLHGRARFVGPTTLAVGTTRLEGTHVLIAAGAMSAPLIGLAVWRGWQRGLQRLGVVRPSMRYLTGGTLLLIGLYGIASGWR